MTRTVRPIRIVGDVAYVPLTQGFMEGRRKHLGYYPTPEAAHATYVEAAKRLHGEFARFE